MIENPTLQQQQQTNNSLDQFILDFKAEKKKKDSMFKSLALLALERRPTLKASKMPLPLAPRRDLPRKEKSNLKLIDDGLLKKTKNFYTPHMPDDQDEERV